ncbi:MAG: MFS transporter [Bacteroidales bacterium]|nr:MFS transporter [Bacteroidales bacterium]
MSKIQEHIKDRFNLKDEDYVKIKLLFFYSFALGFFIAFYFVPANSKFLENFGHQELPYAYIISGVVGVLAISFYSYIQRRQHSKTLFISAVVLMATTALLSRFFLFLIKNNSFDFDGATQVRLIRYLTFFVFIWAWPFIALVATITGGLALRLFNLMQVKNFYGIINLGGVLAAILGYLVISFIVRFISEQYDLILIGSAGLFFAIYLLFYIYKKFPEKKIEDNENQKKIKNKLFGGLLKNKFVLFIFLGALFSAVIIYIADYGFLITIKSNGDLFNSPEAVAKFISIVFAALKIGELFISVFSGRILTKGGMRLGLVILSVVITTLFLFAFISAQAFGSATFLFLAFITANKMLERIIRRGVEDPAFNVLYQTLPENKKLFIQTRVGIVQQGAIALAGLFLIVVNIALQTSGSDFNANFYPLYALPVLITAIIIAFSLFRRYKIRIREILAEKKLFQFEYVEKEVFASDILQKFILSEDIETAKFSTVVLSETNPRSLEAYAGFLLKVDDNIIRKSVLSNIDSTYSEKLVSVIEKVGNNIGFKERDLRKLILQALFKLDYSEIKEVTINEIKRLAFSENVKENITATKYLYKNKFDDEQSVILHLLNSKDKTVKLAAIKIAGRRASRALWVKLIDLLSNTEYNNILINILVEIGEPLLSDLNDYFKKQNDPKILTKIVQIFAKISTPKAQNILVSYLEYPDREIQNDVIQSLYYSGFRASDKNIFIIRDKIKSVVENNLWFLVSIKDLVKGKNTLKLIQALDLERLNSLEQLFILLTFTQSPEIVDLIKTNIIGENTIFAIELIDNFIEPEIKKLIIPLFEPITLGQKIKRLKPFFFVKQLNFEQRLVDIVLAESAKVDIWSQAKAIELIGKLITLEALQSSTKEFYDVDEPEFWTKESIQIIKRNYEISNLAEVFWTSLLHPSELIYTTTIKILHEKGITELGDVIQKLSQGKQFVFKRMINSLDLIPEKIRHLRRVYIFYSVPEKSLVRLADIVTQQRVNKDNDISFFKNGDENIIILVKGQLTCKEKNKEIVFNKNSIIIRGLNAPNSAKELRASINSVVMKINRFKFFNLLASNNELVKNLFKTMKF